MRVNKRHGKIQLKKDVPNGPNRKLNRKNKVLKVLIRMIPLQWPELADLPVQYRINQVSHAHG